MSFTVKSLAELLGLAAEGNLSLPIDGIAEPQAARESELALAMAPKFVRALGRSAARAAIIRSDTDWREFGLEAVIFAPRPRLAMSRLTQAMDPGQSFGSGVHPTAYVDSSAILGEGVSVGPMAVIGPDARVGPYCVIGPLAFLGAHSVLGAHCLLREHASVGARCTLGQRVILQPGARLGSDGFSFVTSEVSQVEIARANLDGPGVGDSQVRQRIHSLGAVTLGDDVEIGANSTVDSGTVRDTEIGDGTKLDNLVLIGHNCVVGRNCLICGHSGIAGSVTIGNDVVIGGKCGVGDNLNVGDSAIVAAGSGVIGNVAAGSMVMGYPALKMDLYRKVYRAQRRLPRLLDRLAKMQNVVFTKGNNE